MVLEVFGSIAAPGEQNNSSGLETMIATDKKKKKNAFKHIPLLVLHSF